MEETIRLREDVEWREVEGEVVALDLQTSRYLAINKSGRFLWRALSTGATRSHLVGEFTANFGIAEDVARRDVDEFITMLASSKLLADGDAL